MKTSFKKMNWVYLLSGTAVVLLVLLIKQTTASKVRERWHWGTAVSDKYLSPVFVNQAVFILPDGGSVVADDLQSPPGYPVSGKWAAGNGSINSNFDELPERLQADWLSLAERTWYKGTFEFPKDKIDRIFRKAKDNEDLQFVIGLGREGKVLLWIRGKNFRQEIASFTASRYQPDWEKNFPETGETETEFVDKVYQRISAVERKELEFVVPKVAKPKNTKAIYSDELEFVALEQNGDNDLLIARKSKDTMAFVCNFNTPIQLERGDKIRLHWKWDHFIATDESQPQEARQFALDFKLLKKGPLSILIQKGFYRLKSAGSPAALSDYGKQIIEYNLKYYLANATDQKIRRVVDQEKSLLYYHTIEKVINGQNTYELSLVADQTDPGSIKKIYFLPERPFGLLEYDDFF